MYKGKKIIAIIPARANSKRCPGKNFRLLGGKPLISWSIDSALGSKFLDKIVVTSDDPKVLKLAAEHKDILVIDRPAHLATDEATSLDVALHALEKLEDIYDYGILLQPTSPFRLSQDIDTSIQNCIDSGAKTCVSYTELSKPSSFFYGSTNGSIKQLNEYDALYRRNGAIYLFEINHLTHTKAFSNLSTLQYTMPEIRSIDIDTEEDFLIAEQLAGVINVK